MQGTEGENGKAEDEAQKIAGRKWRGIGRGPA